VDRKQVGDLGGLPSVFESLELLLSPPGYCLIFIPEDERSPRYSRLMKKPIKGFGPILILILAGVLPLVVNHDYYQHLMIQVLIWVVIGSSWNLLAGYTGQVSFGHAAFFGIGAYTAGILHMKLALSPWWGMAFGGFTAIILGLLIGYLCFRLRGPYFALATLASGEILRLVANNWTDFTEGMVGILIIQTLVSKLP
jgi:branched-chain amino acid transport system permease protein